MSDPATAVEIADAVVATLNGASLSVPMIATRAWLRVEGLEDLAQLRATVIPRAVDVAPRDLTPRVAFTWDVDITIQARADMADNAAVDPLMALAEEIARLFAGKPLGGTAARCVGVSIAPPPPDDGDRMKQFRATITPRFLRTRDPSPN